MIRRSCFLFLLALFFACKPSVPAGILPPAKMQSVLWDLMLADEWVGFRLLSDSSFATLEKHAEAYQQVFAVHRISKNDFRKSMSYYQARPKLFKEMLDSIQAAGERLQRNDDSTKRKSPIVDSTRRRDSLRKKILPIP